MSQHRQPLSLVVAVVAVVALSLVCAACDSKQDEPKHDDELQAFVYPGCEKEGETPSAVPRRDAQRDAGANARAVTQTEITTERELFDARIAKDLDECRRCHVPDGVADDEDGRGLLLGKSADADADYTALRASWEGFGGGITDNALLTKAAATTRGGHSGGENWPTDGAAYADVRALFTCWSSPASCEAALSSLLVRESEADAYPLLGNLEDNGGRNYAAVYCEDKPDCATLPIDPRELISGENLENAAYAVWFNDPFELCQTKALFENQKRGNALLEAQGKKPAYTAKPRPKNCGEWRTAVAHGRDYIVTVPLSGPVLTVQSLINLAAHFDVPIGKNAEDASRQLAEFSQQRYGWPKSPYKNPAPLPGEDPNETEGGSLQLPIALAQVKDATGKWTGKLGMTCFSCHVGQIGQGEVVGATGDYDGHPELYGGADNGLFLGLNGANTDTGTALWDIENANGSIGPNSFNAVLANPTYLTNRSRGTNAADQEIFTLLAGRDPDTLDYRSPLFAPPQGKNLPTPTKAGGDQDVPSWWWTHNKTRYLWVGYGSAGSSRGNYFPGSSNPYDGHWSKAREGDFQDMDLWLNTVEAPKFVGPKIDTKLAEQGAILFHTKDLWAGDDNADIPQPPGGNGSCASCHGAYSPRYIHMPGFLPDPRLAGMTGYTVPLDIVGTDPEQSDTFQAVGRDRESVTSISGQLWMGYPDAQEGYRMPEERAVGEKAFPASVKSIPGRQCGLGALGGYTAQPLHGVWASAPYFHNGSVPTVWGVLDPDARPSVWRRQRVPQSEATPLGDRGYDTRIDRAYDYDQLGWKYEALECDASADAPYSRSCVRGHDLDSEPDPETIVDERTIYNTHAYSKHNGGHAWTKVLTDAERRALVEYLKTL